MREQLTEGQLSGPGRLGGPLALAGPVSGLQERAGRAVCRASDSFNSSVQLSRGRSLQEMGWDGWQGQDGRKEPPGGRPPGQESLSCFFSLRPGPGQGGVTKVPLTGTMSRGPISHSPLNCEEYLPSRQLH